LEVRPKLTESRSSSALADDHVRDRAKETSPVSVELLQRVADQAEEVWPMRCVSGPMI